jgi:hypothetical protein
MAYNVAGGKWKNPDDPASKIQLGAVRIEMLF